MRATAPSTTGTIFGLIFPLALNKPGVREPAVLSVVSLSSLIILTTTVLSFTSTILLSDVTQQPIPNEATNVTIPLDISWVSGFGQLITPSGVNYWKSSPPAIFPTFGEYSTEPLVAPGIVDTGSTIRALLPFTDSKDRSSLRSYKGKALVWDGRVICQKPQVSSYEVINIDNDLNVQGIKGNIKNAIPFNDVVEEAHPSTSQFFCTVYNPGFYEQPLICELAIPSTGKVPPGAPSLNYLGGLKSEFRTPSHTIRPGRAYLVLNRTGLSNIPQQYLDDNPEWGEVGYIPAPEVQSANAGIILGSLCYSAMDAVDRDVEISSTRPLIESPLSSYILLGDNETPGYSPSYQFNDNILSQLIPGNKTKTLAERGVLDLKQPESGWAKNESDLAGSDGPWSYNFTALALNVAVQSPDARHTLMQQLEIYQKAPGGGINDAIVRGNSSVYFNNQSPVVTSANINLLLGNTWIADLFLAVKEHPQGNSAVALQAVFTILLSNAYYDYIQRFNRFENISMIAFQNVSSPGGPFGQRRGSSDDLLDSHSDFPVGYTIVAVALGLHIIFTGIVFILFIKQTTLTRIGDPWQALAHVVPDDSEDVHNIIAQSRNVGADRTTVKNELEVVNGHRTQVGIGNDHGLVRLTRRADGSRGTP
ncbi:Mitochondrial outer membrane protein iml2 [Orbilia ellipsospora]|uniref:Mitochondrial outer membrane protein iml2 n=1 Tax=Orbilia ellipsospora TaxID=2528407 RepID=A0AAV9X556_9PEZI